MDDEQFRRGRLSEPCEGEAVNSRYCLAAILIAVTSFGASLHAYAQNPAAASSAKAQAPMDLTGYWVSFVTEDWRYRMITPPKGDYAGVPMSPEARKIADSWDPAADEAAGNQCKAFGAAAIMRMPTRLHITWQDDNTLRIDTDAGTQTRLLRFATTSALQDKPSRQGSSLAQWERSSSLKVATNNMQAGYLRKNGVPYSENAVLTEYFDVSPLPGGGTVLLLTSVVEDSRYLQTPFIVSSQFKKETDGSKWDPTPCSAK
jgi:hypothetical protein